MVCLIKQQSILHYHAKNQYKSGFRVITKKENPLKPKYPIQL